MTDLVSATTPDDITAAVQASFDDCPDKRLRQVMRSLTSHLHTFVKDVELTEAEWGAAIELLTRSGHITDHERQEFILWSDVLGVSMLVDLLGHGPAAGATESTVLGPFYVPGAPLRDYGASIAERDAGNAGLDARHRARP
jgi:catechol 1,2-dioxygenase